MLKNLSKYSILHLSSMHFKILFSSKAELLSPIYFATLVLIIFQIAIGPHAIGANIVTGIALSSVLLSLIMTADHLLQIDKKDGMLELMYISGISQYWLLMVKFMVLIVMSAVIASAVLFAASMMLGAEQGIFTSMIIPMLALLPIVSIVTLFISLITMGFPNRFIQYTLSLPLIVPAIIFCTYAAYDGVYLTMLLGLNLIYVPLFFFFSKLALNFSMTR